jgi:hypothetical protein
VVSDATKGASEDMTSPGNKQVNMAFEQYRAQWKIIVTWFACVGLADYLNLTPSKTLAHQGPFERKEEFNGYSRRRES